MKTLLRAAARRLGAHHAWRRRNRARLVVVCYHGLRTDDDPVRHWLLISESNFAEQMEYLHRYYRCLPLDDALVDLESGGLRGPTACVTFDDGYLSNRTIALPVLERLQIPATVYLTTGFIGRDENLWTTALEYAVMQSPAGRIDLREWDLGAVDVGPSASAEAQRLVKQLKALPADRRRAIAAALSSRLPPPRLPTAFRFMTWDDVKALEASGLVSIGAHTVHHEILSRLSDNEVRTEIQDSIAEVRRRVSRSAATFAYPNGSLADFDGRARVALEAADCRYAVSTIEGLNDASTDRFALRRVVMGGHDSLDTFRLRTAGVLPAARS